MSPTGSYNWKHLVIFQKNFERTIIKSQYFLPWREHSSQINQETIFNSREHNAPVHKAQTTPRESFGRLGWQEVTNGPVSLVWTQHVWHKNIFVGSLCFYIKARRVLNQQRQRGLLYQGHQMPLNSEAPPYLRLLIKWFNQTDNKKTFKVLATFGKHKWISEIRSHPCN